MEEGDEFIFNAPIAIFTSGLLIVNRKSMKLYLIDGYNVLHASPELKRVLAASGIERARTEMLNGVAGFAERKNVECIVVFDGVVGLDQVTPKVKVVSSHERTADDLIREHARREGKKLAVVTNDLEIIATARANMAEVVPSKAFAAELRTGTHARTPAPPTDGSARPHRIAELRERSEKPRALSDDDIDEWKKLFGA